jgi:N-acetylglucosaminyldiphosphoundecaprenol N-acetyl-beta-D-mannosaminyltransferase
LLEPHRLWKRYLVEDLPFFWLIIKQKFNMYTIPHREKRVYKSGN